jgi:DNA-directed RNA polymerase specialized sigma24 family protein
MTEFARMLEAQIPRLRRYARALTRDVVRADDLIQSCLTRALAKQYLWQPGTNLRAWLFTILHNQHVNDVRRGVRDGYNVPSSRTPSPRWNCGIWKRQSAIAAGAAPSDPARRPRGA